MRRQATLKTLDEIVSQSEAEREALLEQRATLDGRINELAENIDVLSRSMQIVECAKDNFVTAPQSGTLTEQITTLAEQVLGELGPTHRKELLRIGLESGIVIGSKDKLNTFMSYLSQDDRFESAGGGVWRLVASVSESPSVEPESEAEANEGEEGGVLLTMPAQI